MRKKNLQEENKKNYIPPFNVLYTCLSLLVLTFFIFLVANSIIDPEKKKEAIGSLIGSFGMFKGSMSLLGSKSSNKLAFNLINVSESSSALYDLIKIVKNTPFKSVIQIGKNKKGIFFNFKVKSIFPYNKAIIKKEYLYLLTKFYNKIRNYNNLEMDIFSYPDDLKSPKKSGYIASMRAFKIANFFIAKGLEKNKVLAYGELSPNKKIALTILIKGQVHEKLNKNKVEKIEYKDFIFKVK